jgi:hypothetical protein
MGTLKKNKSATPGSACCIALMLCQSVQISVAQFCSHILLLSLKLNVYSVLTFLKIKGDVYKWWSASWHVLSCFIRRRCVQKVSEMRTQSSSTLVTLAVVWVTLQPDH